MVSTAPAAPTCFVCRRPITDDAIIFSTPVEVEVVCSLACMNVLSDPQGTGAWQE